MNKVMCCYIVITHETDFIDDEPRVRTICSCYPNPGHCCHNTCQKIILGYNYYKDAVIHNSRCIYATFMAQKSLFSKLKGNQEHTCGDF